MNCRELEKLLGEGRHLNEAAMRHVSECTGCQALLTALEPEDDPMDHRILEAIQARFSTGVSSVTPLRSDAFLIVLTAGLFAVFTVVVASFVGFQGVRQLSVNERFIYYGCICLFGILFSAAAVQCAIPGAKVRISRAAVAIGSVIATAAVVTLLFRTFELDEFVARGIPCLRFGCICAALFGSVVAVLMRKGYVTDWGATSIVMGCFAGFSGVAVLSLHCPIENSAHIIVWHVGAVGLSALVGLFFGAILSRRYV